MSKTARNPFVSKARGAINEASREGATNTRPALDIRTYRGGPTMPVEANITPKGDSASAVRTGTFTSIGELARNLLEKAVRK